LIATWVKAEPNLAARAAQLAKADLASGMVGEFPELQGVMGRYYAQQGGESEEVSDAVRDHYKPVGAGDEVPRAATTVAVAIADKVDQISGFFLVGEKPSGSSDPFALRRAALGLIRIIRDSGLRLSLREVLLRSAGAIERQMAYAKHEKEYPYPDPNLNVSEPMWGHLEDMSRTAYEEATRGLTHARPYIKYDMPHEFSDEYPEFFSERVQATATEVLDFLFDRLRVQLRAEGARHDVVAAILGNSPDDDLTRLLARADALRALVESEDGANLLAAYRRAANILRIEEKKDAASYTGAELNPAELTLPEEQALAAALDQAVPEAARLLAAENFAEAMAALATLRAPLDAFFDKVLVNEPQFRRNRLALLARLRAAMESVADLSKLEG
jgi:glycyl-tRNA synthetase beta chain